MGPRPRRSARALPIAFLLLSLSPPAAGPAAAQDQPCSFVLGFAAAAESLGREIVGECASGLVYDEHGNAVQRTTTGYFSWRKSDNQTNFVTDERIWLHGSGGLQGTVSPDTASGAPAGPAAETRLATVLFRAVLTAEDLPSGWRLRQAGLAESPGWCGQQVERDPDYLGGVLASFAGPATNQGLTHSISAVRAGAGPVILAEFRAYILACPEWIDTTQGQRVVFRPAELPFPTIGDESFAFRITAQLARSSQPPVAAANVMFRRGDITASIGLSPVDSADDASFGDLERFARLADEKLLAALR